uniref:Pyrin domain-containing protein n=1 Tax=Mola mola TaxID=94237 RepID=A0A3Q3WN86_MOLML
SGLSDDSLGHGLPDLKFFQHLLSLQSDPIPISRLEAADRTRTVDLMVQRYHGEGARQVTKEILRTMEFQQLANQLE